MAKAVTIRNVPDRIVDELARRAARRGQSLQQFLRETLIEEASYAELDERLARIRDWVEDSSIEVDREMIVADLRADRGQ
jgi:plasmid stability protein